MVSGQADKPSDEWGGEEEEYAPLEIPPEFRDVAAKEMKITVRELWQRYLAQELILEPDFQRHYVWDRARASRFVESLLLGLPTPALFLSQEARGRWIVIDGHQRLETLFRFMQPLLRGTAPAEGKTGAPYSVLTPLTLGWLDVMTELNGKGVTALSIQDRKRLWDTSLPVILLSESTHPDMKYVLFARLNQGSMSLNSQELRNCLYRGPYNRLIAELSESQRFLSLWGKTAADKRMRHRELVLRFFALLHRMERYRTPFRVFLNDEMEENGELDVDDRKRFQQEFEHAVTWTERVFGREALRPFRVGNATNPAGNWGARRHDLIYEVEMVGFAQFGEQLARIWNACSLQEQQQLRMILRHRLVDVMTGNQFRDTLSEGTKSPAAVNTRFTLWNRGLEGIVANPGQALEEAEALHGALVASNVCARCPYQMAPDDAVWLPARADGGLVHRFCRNQRP